MAQSFDLELQLLTQLASGGMADLFLGRQTGAGGFEKFVAVKRMSARLAEDPQFDAMFRGEIRLLAKLQHKNIAQVYRSGSHDGFLYIVMEFIDGKTLHELMSQLQRERIELPLEMKCYIIAEAAQGLHFAHTFADDSSALSLGIVHRDVSPQNIMVSYSGEVKLLDFGIAKAIDSLDVTKTGTLKGKLAYMSPEQVREEELDQRSDVFALGVVFYELVAERRLFGGHNVFEIARKIREGEVPTLTCPKGPVPKELSRIVMKALATDREERYQSAGDLYRDIVLLLNSEYPSFVPNDLAQFLTRVFAGDIEAARQLRLERSAAQATKVDLALHGSLDGVRRPSSLIAPRPTMKARSYLPVVAALALLLVTILYFRGATYRSLRAFGMIAQFRPDLIVTDEDGAVRSWSGEGPATTIAMQHDPARRPHVSRSPINGSRMLSFDGKDDFLVLDELAPQIRRASALTIFFVGRPAAEQKQYVLTMHAARNEDDVVRVGFDTGGRLLMSDRSPNYYRSDAQVGLGELAVYSMIANGTSLVLYRNSIRQIAATLSTGVELGRVERVTIGQDWDPAGPSDYFSGQLAALLIFDRVLSDEERSQVESYLTTNYAIGR